nr:kelch repeat-containing protein [Lewinella sp. JB7]
MVSYKGEFYYFNGFTTDVKFLNVNEKYNPATNTWTKLSSIPNRPDGSFGGYTHTPITVVGDQIWLAGGRSGNYGYHTTKDIFVYDIPTDSWSMGPRLPQPGGGGGMARLGRKVHYFGGFDYRSGCDVDFHFVYDLDHPELGWQDFTDTSPMPLARNHFGTVTLGGKLYAVAGQHGHEGCQKGKNMTYVHRYDPFTDTWERLADFPHVQSHIEPSTFAYNGKIYSLGGQGQESAKVVEYDPETNTWRSLDDMTLPLRLIAPGARVYNGNLVVMAGGEVSVNRARPETRVKTFRSNQTKKLGFHPAVLNTTGKERRTTEVILSNYSAEDEVTYTIQTSDLPAWLKIDRSSGLARESFAEVEVTVDPLGLPNGTYSYTLRATAPGYQAATLNISFTVGQDGSTPQPFLAFREAECAQVGTNWVVGKHSTASNGAYINIKPGLNSTSSVPGDPAANHVSFTFDIPRADTYQFFARADAPTTSDDSFWFRLNGGEWIRWYQGLTTYNTGFQWSLAPQSPFSLPAGRVVVEIAYREDGLKLDKILLSSHGKMPTDLGGSDPTCGGSAPPPPPPPPPSGSTTYWAEAECAPAGGNWSRQQSSAASNNGYVYFRGAHEFNAPNRGPGSADVSFTTTAMEAGKYYLNLRLNAPDNSTNSLWVSVDGGSWIKFWKNTDGSNMLTNGFEWKQVNDDTRPISFNLAAGTHTITVANREAGTMLDKVHLSTSSALPTGTGSAATNCTGQLATASSRRAQTGVPVAEENTLNWLEVFPNPVANELRFDLEGTSEGRVELRLTDAGGRTVLQRAYDKATPVLTDRIDVSGLPAGVYHLQLVTGTERISRTVLKGR